MKNGNLFLLLHGLKPSSDHVTIKLTTTPKIITIKTKLYQNKKRLSLKAHANAYNDPPMIPNHDYPQKTITKINFLLVGFYDFLFLPEKFKQ